MIDQDAIRLAFARVQERFPGTWPEDYALLCQAGEDHSIGNDFRVLQPGEVAEATAEWRERVKEYWFWPESPRFNRKLVDRHVVVADTTSGDEVVLDPETGIMTFLCRDADDAYSFEQATLLDVAIWLERSGDYQEPGDQVIALRPWE